jgi:hypothetical protein
MEDAPLSQLLSHNEDILLEEDAEERNTVRAEENPTTHDSPNDSGAQTSHSDISPEIESENPAADSRKERNSQRPAPETAPEDFPSEFGIDHVNLKRIKVESEETGRPQTPEAPNELSGPHVSPISPIFRHILMPINLNFRFQIKYRPLSTTQRSPRRQKALDSLRSG